MARGVSRRRPNKAPVDWRARERQDKSESDGCVVHKCGPERGRGLTHGFFGAHSLAKRRASAI
jgi:hypothetical protein